jgi:hypothetical protein
MTMKGSTATLAASGASAGHNTVCMATAMAAATLKKYRVPPRMLLPPFKASLAWI